MTCHLEYVKIVIRLSSHTHSPSQYKITRVVNDLLHACKNQSYWEWVWLAIALIVYLVAFTVMPVNNYRQ